MLVPMRIPVSITEGHYYKKNDISIKNKKFYEKLRELGVIEFDDKSCEEKFKLNFVGVIVFEKFLIYVLPKYCPPQISVTEAKDIIRLIIKVFRRYNSDKMTYSDEGLMLDLYTDNGIINEIALADFVIMDYINNGLYKIRKKHFRYNYNNDINWERTIANIQPVINEETVIYPTLIHNEYEYNYSAITDVQIEVLKYCIQLYGDIIDENIEISFNDENIGVSNEIEVIEILESEIEKTYRDREYELLIALLSFFKQMHKDNSELNFALYGTRRFDRVWERACKVCLKDQFDEYKDKIAVPKWFDNNIITYTEVNTLEPDILIEFINYFLILDAKYYNIRFNKKKIEGKPGIQDIVKQYAYELALKGAKGNSTILNAFIFPKYQLFNIESCGGVILDFFGLKPIVTLFLSADEIFRMYVDGVVFSDEQFDIIIETINKCHKEYNKKLYC